MRNWLNTSNLQETTPPKLETEGKTEELANKFGETIKVKI